MNPSLSCYGTQVDGVADLVGDCDLRSPAEVHGWFRLEHEAMAAALGYSQQLAAMLPSRAVSSPVMAFQQAGLEAYARSLQHAAKQPESQARTQSAVLQQLVAVGRERGELWRVSVDPTTLPTGACYEDQGQALRAFYPDTAPGYFGEGWEGPRPRAESACGWQTPLVLHLGTFPWVYSSRIDAVGPGARWASATAQPAILGLQLAASLMSPRPTCARTPGRSPPSSSTSICTRSPCSRGCPCSSPVGRRPGGCIAAAAFYMCTRAASTSRRSTARADGCPRPLTTISCADSRASSRSAARPCGRCRRCLQACKSSQ
jgi:hypothetical protein